ncbi:cyanophycin synthetase [Undibacterium fentianense]|uniref:Cyanophycin synthetase n=1 Tax=Undibacterium fentianense TaxID=2828728 RepID=A0A941ICK1_9BURK|nr:cyanophycin synthetase [Undibacterium fentianense]MBR7798963.1 cyanophycin synthetase [Undibacterium fentianense]
MTTKKKDITPLSIKHLRGPNIWTYRPVIEVYLDIGEFEQLPSNLLPGLYERLTATLPGLMQHRCGVGEIGGFLERLKEGTWVGHILEHVVLELQNLAGMKTGFGQTRSTHIDGVYKMAFRTRQEQVGRAAFAMGRELLLSLIDDKAYDFDGELTKLRDMVDALCLGPSTAHIVDAATDRNIPSIRLTEGNLVQLGHGAAQRRIWTAETDRTSAIAESIASDKDMTKSLLKACGVPVPEGSLVRSAEEAWEEAQDIGLPVVVKPYDGNHGRGVTLNLMTQEDVHAAYEIASHQGDSRSVIVERYVVGDEHRLLVVGNKLAAAAKGESLWVNGDGKSSIKQLVAKQINTDPRRGETEEFPLGLVKPDQSAEIILELKRQGMNADSIPARDQKVLIQPNGNVAIDVTDQVHPENARLVALATRIVGLDIAGIDLVCEDISRPLQEQKGAIIEVNASPGLLSHLKPAVGKPREVGAAIIEHLFGPEDNGRMPIVGIAGSRGGSLIARLVSSMLSMSGTYSGVACADGLYLDQRQVVKSDCTSWDAGQRLLLNRNVQNAVFETNAKRILENGLAYDKCAVGVVTDLDGFEDLADFYINDAEQMFKILRTQVDVVLPSGCAVINAEIAQAQELADLSDGEVIYYGHSTHNTAICKHLQIGKRAVYLQNDQIVLATGSQERNLLALSSLKASKAEQPLVIMAAVAAAWALDITPDLIAAALRNFDSNPPKKHY